MMVKARTLVWPPSCAIVDYHQLSFTLSVFKFFMIVDDSFSRLTTRMIVDGSFSVSCILPKLMGSVFGTSSQRACNQLPPAHSRFVLCLFKQLKENETGCRPLSPWKIIHPCLQRYVSYDIILIDFSLIVCSHGDEICNNSSPDFLGTTIIDYHAPFDHPFDSWW